MAPSRTETRGRLLCTAARLFRRQGYDGTGLNQLLAEGQAPKGSLYFHFPGGKEQIAVEAVALAAGELGQELAARLDAAPDAASGIRAIGAVFAESLETSGYQDGCPVATVALDAAAESEALRTACAGAYGAWLSALATRLRGYGVPAPKADELAALVLSGIQGALILARVQHDTTPIEQVACRLGALVESEVTS